MEFRIERADVNDAEAIAAVIQIAYEQLEHKEWYNPDDAEYMRELLSAADGSDANEGSIRGIGYKAIEEKSGALAGIFTVAFPGDSPKNMGWDLGFDAEKCRRTAHMDTAAVLPEYRGYHLQDRLMQTAEQQLRQMGYRYLTSTVHPDNHSSKNTMLRQGYQVMATKEKYGGYLRNVMLKIL